MRKYLGILLWLCLFIISGVISPLISSSILGTYRPGEIIFQRPIFFSFHTVHGVLKARILVCHPHLQWATFCQWTTFCQLQWITFWLKTQHSENEDHGIWSHHFMANRWGNNWKQVKDFILGGSKITADVE